MNKHIYYLGGLLLLFTSLSSCTANTEIADEIVTGNVPISLAGALSRTTGSDCGDGTGTTYDNLYLYAKTEDKNNAINNGKLYFSNEKLAALTLASTSETNKTDIKLAGGESLFYPLSNIGLRFISHSGVADANNDIALTAGTATTNDYIISNGTDGTGTYGDINQTNTILTFRHIMTKVYVDVVVDETETPDHVDPAPKTFQLTLNDKLAVKKGKFAITSTGNATPDDASGNYTLSKGVNYLIPNGSVLADENNNIHPIEHLKIDDYDTNNTQDCKNLTITPAAGNANKEVKLLPGFAYKITFKIKRLKVTEITFKMIDWDTVVLNSENSSYIPAKLTMDLGSYEQTEAKDTITKVVLHSNDQKQYVGNILYEGALNAQKPVGQFVSLPTDVSTVDLYTSRGLLIAGVIPNAGSYQNTGTSQIDKDIIVTLSKGGMKTVNSSQAYDKTNNPYQVETPLHFLNLSKDMSASYQQKNDLDLESLIVAFTPFTEEFKGIYDGNGKRILHGTFTGNGLFATNSGKIANIRIASGKISATGGTYAGSICKENLKGGTIVACINEAQIHGSGSHAGGICGKNSGTIIACLNTGDIFTGSSYSGGICGENISGGTIIACVNVGMMNRKSGKMAGICGTSASVTESIKTCYWLTGTAKGEYNDNSASVTHSEVAVHNYTPANDDDVADLSPQKLRDDKGIEEPQTTTELLSTACSSTTGYKFTYNISVNGCVWPMPVKK